MKNFSQEFVTLNFVIKKAERILLFAHSRPDGDTVGSVLALKEFLEDDGKICDVACMDPFPFYLSNLSSSQFELPANLNLKKYDLIIACDSVERGFGKMKNSFGENQVIALIDHHPGISLQGDINIFYLDMSSTCEIIFEFFQKNKIEITRNMAKFLLLGILSDTGMFQHSNTTPRVMEIASYLMKKGAPLAKIVSTAFSNKNISTLKLWGKAFEKARINQENGMIASVLTQKDLEDCDAGMEDIAQVAGILNSVPGTKFSLILSEREGGIVKGSLRSEEYKEVDVSRIATKLGGGGHKLASGFEVKGRVVETKEGWKIV